MKKLMMKLKSFILFDFPVKAENISEQFNKIHLKHQTERNGWSTTATSQVLISKYWHIYVLSHFSSVLVIPVLTLVFIQGTIQFPTTLLAILTISSFIYLVLHVFHYRPLFSTSFLPNLLSIQDAYNNKQSDYIEKCKKAQLGNLALTLIFYSIYNVCRLNSLQCNEQTAQIMARLFGVDPGSLKKNLALILGKRKSFSLRKTTEIRNQFEEAFTLLEEMKFTDGVEVLKKLERRIFSDQYSLQKPSIGFISEQ